ncbi:hypothetical protein [Streptomyces sp. AC550_RSS872]|uniref:hypothetical protein n=1 Tax=Streptomyces sp. AC550_RSS872 TaxID=2823689 RepID=UPI001C273B6C|nr:hypothetical protein [Streptomyces sp. AC550_RSS872]
MEWDDGGAGAQGLVFQGELTDGFLVEGEGAAQLGVLLSQPGQIRLPPLVGLGGLCLGHSWGGLRDVGPEVGVDQVGVVAVEGGVGDAEAPLDGGDGGAVSFGGCLFEDGVDGGLDGVGVGQGTFHSAGSGAWRARNAAVSRCCS